MKTIFKNEPSNNSQVKDEMREIMKEFLKICEKFFKMHF